MVVGATTSGVFLVAYVLGMEMVGPKYRVVAGTLCQYYYTFGYFLMAFVAFFLNYDWQLLQVGLLIYCYLQLSKKHDLLDRPDIAHHPVPVLLVGGS